MDKISVGEKIKEIRKEKNLTQAQLADLVEMSVQSINKIEKGINKPNGTTVSKIATVLNVTLNDIYGTYDLGIPFMFETAISRNIRKLLREQRQDESFFNEPEAIEKLSKDSGISLDVMKKIIFGEFLPSNEAMKKIAESLGVDKDEILKPDDFQRRTEEVELVDFLQYKKHILNQVNTFFEHAEDISYETEDENGDDILVTVSVNEQYQGFLMNLMKEVCEKDSELMKEVLLFVFQKKINDLSEKLINKL